MIWSGHWSGCGGDGWRGECEEVWRWLDFFEVGEEWRRGERWSAGEGVMMMMMMECGLQSVDDTTACHHLESWDMKT